ncbi:MAG: T9SS type A sorting domain-containing protein, partial [Chitinophagaceae bacterium]
LNNLGVVVNTGSGYGVVHNSFAAQAGSVYGTGVDIINTGSDNNIVHSNDYSGLWCGNLSNFLNRSPNTQIYRGLQFLCNTDNNNTHDIAGRGHHNFGGTSIEGMGANQGSATKAAGNTFSPNALYNIYNYTSEVQPINYYYSSGSGSFPAFVYGVNRYSGIPNSCDYPNDNNGSTGGTWGFGDAGALAFGKVAYFMSDSSGMAFSDSLDQALTDWGSPYADLTRADLLIENADFDQANTVYNAIASTHDLAGPEADEFMTWGRRLMDLRISLIQDSLGMNELNTAQVQNLEGIADSANLWAKVRARNWLTAFDGRVFVTEMLFPQDSNQHNGQRMIKANDLESYVVSPNPVKDVMQVNFTQLTNQTGNVTIADVSGRIIRVDELEGLSGTLDISLSTLETGIYFYKIMQGAIVKQTGKFVKQ